MRQPSHRTVALFVAVALTSLLTACSSPANRESMTPPAVVVSKHFAHSLSVQTSGGNETGALDSSNISDADLKAAIEEAVVQSRLFKGIVQGNSGDYELNVRVASLTKPVFGLTFTVEMEAGWSLIKLSDHTVALRKSIKSSGTATTSDAFAAVTRLRLAVEAAARDNISQGLKSIAELNL